MEMSQENQSDTEKGDTKSPPRHKRKRSSPRRSAECVTINLYGELAELWDDERGTLSDTQFVEQLLCLRERYEWLKSRCKCGVSLEAESGDSGGENVCPESDDEVMNLPDANDMKLKMTLSEVLPHPEMATLLRQHDADENLPPTTTNGDIPLSLDSYYSPSQPGKRRQYDTPFKAEIILELESGVPRSDIMDKYKISKSMVCRWLQDKDRILEAATTEYKKDSSVRIKKMHKA